MAESKNDKEEKVLHLFAIQAKDGVLIASGPDKPDGRYNSPADNFRYDGKKLERTWHKDWFKLDKMPELVEEKIPRKVIRKYVALINPELTPDLTPEMNIEDCKHSDGNYSLEWNDEYKSVGHLYEESSDYSEETWEPVKFDVELLGVLKGSIGDGEVFFSAAKETALYGETKNIAISSVGYQLIDKLVFPPPMLAERLCKLSSHASYRIIRQHVKDNIDPKYAKITSDYDFCFSVIKKVQLATPYEQTFTTLIGKGKRQRKQYDKKLVTDRRETIFEMTYSPKCYGGYPAIPGFRGKTHKDLKKNVDKFLADLMARINEPLVDCPHCDGRGVIAESKDPREDK